jgi:hypothetical protein
MGWIERGTAGMLGVSRGGDGPAVRAAAEALGYTYFTQEASASRLPTLLSALNAQYIHYIHDKVKAPLSSHQ